MIVERDGKKILLTPIADDDIADLRIGDIIYLTGGAATCRDDGHKRLTVKGIRPQYALKGKAVLHAGPIVKKNEDGTWQMVSVGPTTSMRMEQYEKAFISETGVKVIIGKGGMGADTAAACATYKAIHCVYPGGCAVVAADQVERIAGVEWEDFGMPEAFWILQVREFGPLIVSIDTQGNNLFENHKKQFRENAWLACRDQGGVQDG